MNKYVAEWQLRVSAVPDGRFGPATLAASIKAIGDTVGPVAVPDAPYTQQPWVFRQSDLAKLNHAEPELRAWVIELAKRSRFRFGVFECKRTLAKQKKYVASGVSWTLNSLHRIQPDGYAHAVDLVWLNERGGWDWGNAEQYKYLAHLGVEVARELDFPVRNLGLSIGKDWYHFERQRGR